MTAEAILVHLGLGSNLGDRKEYLSMACNQLCSEAVREFRESSIYESEPLLKMPQPKYLNMVVCGLTIFRPRNCLKNVSRLKLVWDVSTGNAGVAGKLISIFSAMAAE